MRGHELVFGPLISGVEFDADKIAGVLKNTIPNPAMVATVGVKNRYRSAPRNGVLNLDTGTAGRNIFQCSQLFLLAA